MAAAAHVIASQPPSLCPLLEFLLQHAVRQQFFHTAPLMPVDGHLPLPAEPGLGMVLDESKIEERREPNWG
ncbi:MAG: hypothetical protein KAX19_08490 [Candidatus Brocadiae bacterium]|nr:hypothetical protein [Candidatus Brocadiia bacterium]